MFELMATQTASESIGVVALSRPQADLIESLIEERRLLNRHLDHRFSVMISLSASSSRTWRTSKATSATT